MAAADASTTFNPVEITQPSLEQAASVERLSNIHGERAERSANVLPTGQRAPSFSPVRPIPEFLRVAGGPEDTPECNHVMGWENH